MELYSFGIRESNNGLSIDSFTKLLSLFPNTELFDVHNTYFHNQLNLKGLIPNLRGFNSPWLTTTAPILTQVIQTFSSQLQYLRFFSTEEVEIPSKITFLKYNVPPLNIYN